MRTNLLSFASALLILATQNTPAPDRGRHLNITPPESVRRLVKRAVRLAEGDQPAAAVAVLKKAITASPDYLRAHIEYRNVEANFLDKSDDVREEYQSLIRRDPDNPVYLMAVYYRSDGKYGREFLEKVVKVAPEWAWGHYAKALLLRDDVDDLIAAMTLARHLSTDGSLASALIANTLEQGPANLLARHLPELRGREVEQVSLRYDSLPPSVKMADVLLSHERISRGMMIGVLKGEDRRQEIIKRLSTLEPFREGGASEFLDECGGTAEGIRQKIEQLRPQYMKWAKWFDLAPEEFEKKYRIDVASLEKSNPVFRLLTPAIDKVRWAESYH